MSDTTKIQWCDATWNPWEGCTKVSPGCAHCYAEARNQRFSKGANWGPGKPRRRTSAANWKNPIKWNREAGRMDGITDWSKSEPRLRIFPSLCDWLDEEVPIEWTADLLKLIHDTPNLDWLLLTKRPENWLPHLNLIAQLWACDGSHRDTPEAVVYHDLIVPWRAGIHPRNVWIGASVENQEWADKRIPQLLQIPAAVRFLSVEPMLGPVDLSVWLGDLGGRRSAVIKGIEWVIYGGESGPGARPCNVEWIRNGVRQCKAAGVPVFCKQVGSHPIMGREDHQIIRDKKGGVMEEWPADLRIRQFHALRIT